jgi:hypothetical protein
MKKSIMLIFLLALVGVLAAQQWSVKVKAPPTNQFFFEGLWSCQIKNNEKSPVEVKLYGSITLDN